MATRSRKPLEPRSEQCVAHTRPDPVTGERDRCKNLSIRGTTVCRMHGGSTKTTRAKAADRVAKHVAEGKIAKFLQENKIEPVDNPLEALSELAGEIVMVKNWLRDQVQELNYESNVQGDQISAIMQLYSNFLDKSDRVLVNIAKLNIDERLAHIQMVQAQTMALVFAEALNKMGYTGDSAQRGKVIIGQLLERYDK